MSRNFDSDSENLEGPRSLLIRTRPQENLNMSEQASNSQRNNLSNLSEQDILHSQNNG